MEFNDENLNEENEGIVELEDLYEIITLENEEGKEMQLAIMSELEYNDKTYIVASIIDEDEELTTDEEGSIEYVVFEKTPAEEDESEDEEELVQVEDEDLINSIVGLMEAMEEFDVEEEEDEDCVEENCEGCSGCDDDVEDEEDEE